MPLKHIHKRLLALKLLIPLQLILNPHTLHLLQHIKRIWIPRHPPRLSVHNPHRKTNLAPKPLLIQFSLSLKNPPPIQQTKISVCRLLHEPGVQHVLRQMLQAQTRQAAQPLNLLDAFLRVLGYTDPDEPREPGRGEDVDVAAVVLLGQLLGQLIRQARFEIAHEARLQYA